MIQLINRYNRSTNRSLLSSMHADRKRVFIDQLKWDVAHDDHGEADEFDDDEATYLISSDRATGRHLASLRLLRTDRRHILGDIFPELCDEEAPRGPEYREITRLCFTPRSRRRDRIAHRNLLARGLVEYAHFTGIRGYTLVTNMAWLSQILSAGWTVRPLGLPRMIEGDLIGALAIAIGDDTLTLMDAGWRVENAPVQVVSLAPRGTA